MKIICVGRNYTAHIKELENEKPEHPILFLKPDTSIVLKKQPFFIPDFSNDVHHEVEILVKIKKIGKHIDKKFAHKYYDEIGLGIDFTARDLQLELKAKGQPWELAKGFDGSAVIGDFVSLDTLPGLSNIEFYPEKNGERVQHGFSKDMLFSFQDIICFVSQYFKLQMGDYIYTGTPAGVGPVVVGDELRGFLMTKDGAKETLACNIR